MDRKLIPMKITWLFSILLILLTAQLLKAQQKHALLIGISQYDDPNWNPINAANDTVILKDALSNCAGVDQFGNGKPVR